MKKLFLLCSSALVAPMAITVVPVPAMAQQITTEISGRVTNASGAPLANATVTITDTRTGSSQEITTNSDGLFSARNLQTGGPYTVTAIADGYQGQTVEQIVTNLQGATQLTFSLDAVSEQITTETIVVTGTRARVTQLEVGPGTSFGAQVMETAPSYNRDVRDIIRIDPRVSLDREDTATGGSGVDRISCLGSNDRGNAFTVDGTPQGDVYGLNDTGFSSRSSTPVPYDAVRETQVQFAPYDVEYGNFTGCAINVVTKSGTNKFHGGAFYEFSSKDWRGDELPDRTVGGVDDDKRWGVNFGGPIIKDRLFFFGAYENQKGGLAQDEGPTGANFANPMTGISVDQFNAISDTLRDVYGIDTGPLVTVRPFSNKRYFGRLDWQITDAHRLETTYQRLEESTIRSDDFFTGSSPQLTGLNSFYESGTKSDYYSARLYSRWNDVLSSEIRYSFSDIQDKQDPVGGGEAQSDNPIPRIIVGINNPTGIDGVVQAGPGANRSANDLKTKLTQIRGVVNADTGAHKFKIGFDYNKAKLNNLFINNATGTLVFRNLADLQQGLLSPGCVGTPCNSSSNNQTGTFPNNVIAGETEGAFGNFTPTGDPLTAAAKFSRTIFSPFIQDDWRITDQLNAVIGVRMDFFSGGEPALNPNFLTRYGIPNNTGFNDIDAVALPRIAFTYDANDFLIFSATQVRAGLGLFSGGDPLVWFANGFQNNGQNIAQANLQAPGCPAQSPAFQVDVVDASGNFTGIPTCVVDRGKATAAAGQGFVQSVDPDIKLPTVLRANFGIQTALNFANTGFFSNWRLNLDYIYSRYRNPFTMVDLTQVVDPRIGLSGYTIDGRPIYRTIDPLLCGAELVDIAPTPIYEGVTNACFTSTREDELMLTNAGSYSSQVASAFLSKSFNGGIFTSGGRSYFSVGYAFTDSHDRRNMYNSTATSNYDQTAAFDRQDPDVSRGFFGSRHNFTVSGSLAEQFIPKHDTRLSFTFVARAGRPYSLTFGGSGRFNDSASGSNNALLYIPTGVNDPNISPSSTISAAALGEMVDFLHGLGCAKKYAGRTVARNSCSNDWYYDMDVTLSQELPGPGRLMGRYDDTIKVFASVDNFLNLLNKDWNIQRRRQFAGLQDIATLASTPVDAQGRYVITGFNGVADFKADNFINVSSSVWRLKVGVSYEF